MMSIILIYYREREALECLAVPVDKYMRTIRIPDGLQKTNTLA